MHEKPFSAFICTFLVLVLENIIDDNNNKKIIFMALISSPPTLFRENEINGSLERLAI